MKRSHKTQHKESKPSEIKKTQEMRSELQKLKRENSRLRKELDKRETLVIEAEQDSEQPDVVVSAKIDIDECPQCHQSKLKKVKLGARMLVACESCQYRKMSE